VTITVKLQYVHTEVIFSPVMFILRAPLIHRNSVGIV
jgi:hypothetical protein